MLSVTGQLTTLFIGEPPKEFFVRKTGEGTRLMGEESGRSARRLGGSRRIIMILGQRPERQRGGFGVSEPMKLFESRTVGVLGWKRSAGLARRAPVP